MIRERKSENVPSSLLTTSQYDGEDVKAQLLEDQHEKCYICERKLGTDFEIEQDGSFSGTYHDSELGSTGDDYPDGTMYLCSFSGKFTNLRKINKYTYEMDMEDLTYENTPGEEEIADNMKYIYDEAYGLAGCDTFKVYLPGTPVRDLTDEEYQWVRWANEGDGEDAETLAIQVIVNEKEEFAMYSYMAYPQDESFYERAWDYLDTYGQTYETLKKELEAKSRE